MLPHLYNGCGTHPTPKHKPSARPVRPRFQFWVWGGSTPCPNTNTPVATCNPRFALLLLQCRPDLQNNSRQIIQIAHTSLNSSKRLHTPPSLENRSGQRIRIAHASPNSSKCPPNPTKLENRSGHPLKTPRKRDKVHKTTQSGTN